MCTSVETASELFQTCPILTKGGPANNDQVPGDQMESTTETASVSDSSFYGISGGKTLRGFGVNMSCCRAALTTETNMISPHLSRLKYDMTCISCLKYDLYDFIAEPVVDLPSALASTMLVPVFYR